MVQARFRTELHTRRSVSRVLVRQHLYVVATDAVLVFPYTEGVTRVDAAPQQLVALPGGPINHHWTKNIIANANGSKLYVTVGSNSNIGENGMAAEQGRAAIWEINSDGSGNREFATGLRNPNGMAWEPGSKVLWRYWQLSWLGYGNRQPFVFTFVGSGADRGRQEKRSPRQ